MKERFDSYFFEIKEIKEIVLNFEIEKYMKDDKKRVYIYVNSIYWEIMRK